MNNLYLYRITFNSIEPFLGGMTTITRSTKWMSLEQALDHPSIRESNARLINRNQSCVNCISDELETN